MPGGHREAGENILETAKRELQEETGAIKFEIKPICVYSVTGKTRVNDTGEETFGLLCFSEITEFAKELHSKWRRLFLWISCLRIGHTLDTAEIDRKVFTDEKFC